MTAAELFPRQIERALMEDFFGVLAGVSRIEGPRPSFKIGVTGQAAEIATWLRERYGEEPRFEVAQARWTLAELEDLAWRIARDRDDLDRSGVEVNLIGVDSTDNVVDVGVGTDPARARRTLAKRYGKPAIRAHQQGRFFAAAARAPE